MRVLVRVRPLLFHELETNKVCQADSQSNTLRVYDPRTRHDLLASYDVVIDEAGTQEDVFSHVSAYTGNFLNGYNCTIFAYGQTGTGKTHTMFGFGFSNAEEFEKLEQKKRRRKLRKGPKKAADLSNLQLQANEPTMDELYEINTMLNSSNRGLTPRLI